MPPTLNIAALTRRTGVPADTIRKWEQRYDVLHPHRTAGGQRRYTELDVSRVEWLKARLGEGFRIGEAVALLGTAPFAVDTADELCAAIVDAAVRSDVDALAAAVGQALLFEPVDAAFAEVFRPALVEIGELWQAGRVTVAQEHLASGAIRAALQRLVADQRASVRGVSVLACAPGERHEIGLLMLAVLLRADGWQVAYLGPDTPVADAAELAHDLAASALLFSASRTETAAALRSSLALADIPRHATVILGGRAFDGAAPAHAVESLRRRAA